MATIPNSANSGSSRFQRIVDVFLAQPGLPFAGVLSAERIERIFAQHGNLFGVGAIYSTAVMVWSFLGQVLRDGKEASCQSAVARIVTYCEQQELAAPTADTGDYCKARAKLSAAALRDLGREVAAEVEHQADADWLWKGLHAKLVDGFTFTMPDTKANQAEYPSPKTQKKGVGLPIARAAVILSLATACALDLAVGPYSGKETGETALILIMASASRRRQSQVKWRCPRARKARTLEVQCSSAGSTTYPSTEDHDAILQTATPILLRYRSARHEYAHLCGESDRRSARASQPADLQIRFRQCHVALQRRALDAPRLRTQFYLKQVLQELLRGIERVKLITNSVDVVSATGLSSDRSDIIGLPPIQ